MTTSTKDSDKKRIAQAMAYYIAQGETPFAAREAAMDQIDWAFAAREAAMDQIDWEDSQGEENRWKGPNDTLENLHWI